MRGYTNIKLRFKLENNTKMDIKDLGWEGVGWIHLAQVRDYLWTVEKAEMEFTVPKRALNFDLVRKC